MHPTDMRINGIGAGRAVIVAMMAPLAAFGLAGCVVAGGSTGGGWFIWPGGGLGLLLLVLLVVFLLRRR